MTFSEIGNRFSSLSAQPDIPAVEADKEIVRLGQTAAGLFLQCERIGLKLFDIGVKWQIPPTGDTFTDMGMHGLLWEVIVRAAERHFPERVTLLAGAGEAVPGIPGARIYAPERWRQRAADYAAVCRLLAELGGENPPAADRLILDEARLQARFNADVFDVSEYQLLILDKLITADGAWVSGKDLKQSKGSRPDQALDKLPNPLQAIVERGGTRKGYRLYPSAFGRHTQ